ncbi:anti-sigma factor [Exiguobacterium aurantiacum]|uniref:Anti-sigma-W factor RsiW n=1 Tax=Exiguobacterium aurantiacum TaxID=33987 RepID=A0A377FQ45_9BACL|nr:anti-sigma factor [Exiguobacterium aurantiacum]STO06951.1 putative anti-sigmaE protein [Exiguobacterium aurantiacum]
MNACDQLIDYFNQHLTEEERLRFEAHLATCETCQQELEQLEALVGGVAFLSEPAEPPSGMKARILDNVFAEDEQPKAADPAPVTPFTAPKEKRKTPWGAFALAAVLALSLIGNGYLLLNQNEPAGIALIDTVPLQGESEGVAYLAEQDGDRQLIVQTNGLAPLEANEVYQVWLLKDGSPIPTGAFVTDDKGNGTVIYTLDSTESATDWDTVAITKEPERGNLTPVGEVVLSASL